MTIDLLTAVTSDKIIAVKRALKKGHDINQVDEDGNTAIHIACWNRNLAILRLLIDFKPDLEQSSDVLLFFYLCLALFAKFANKLCLLYN